MDQGDGQTHESPESLDAVQEHALEAAAPALANEGKPADKLTRGRKRTPVRVDAAESPDGEATSADGAAGPSESASRKEIPSIADRVEAVILSTERALSPERIAIALGLVPEDTESPTQGVDDQAPTKPGRTRKRPQSLVEESISRVDAAVTELNAIYEQTGRSFRIEAVAGGYRVMTMSRYAPDVARLRNAKVSSKLSRAAIETLAIIAYKQPMTRAELEAIRGVSCGEVLKSLLERRLITIKGRAEELGRPMLYGTTREFLDHFGLASIKDLPTVEELRASAGA